MWNSLLFQLGQFIIDAQIKEVLEEGFKIRRHSFLTGVCP